MFFSKTTLVTALLSVLQLAAAAPASSEGASSLTARSNSGEFTFYSPGLGACGITSTDSDLVVALAKGMFDAQTPNGNPNNNPLCGKKINASFQGKSVTVTIVDSCPGCAGAGLDLSPTAFSQLADQTLGHVSGTWDFA
ncbi:RlpA-like double-psi beta-barrel-protein domain-containing protein-containing protein [Lasiosphaeria ovina]|uniref:RlpA-like double-psi beta-barrel-protein domain-containing protein-containing protein n=1 Tax=Lasiosphaeria ovina TaxID=92902 RepID=A0AAE0NBU4_9PEZI|nr:RlpA-like double-psi beta-barrel-protein domain-containing protein-containing protein [Lasiosphaeria ovina]